MKLKDPVQYWCPRPQCWACRPSGATPGLHYRLKARPSSGLLLLHKWRSDASKPLVLFKHHLILGLAQILSWFISHIYGWHIASCANKTRTEFSTFEVVCCVEVSMPHRMFLPNLTSTRRHNTAGDIFPIFLSVFLCYLVKYVLVSLKFSFVFLSSALQTLEETFWI